MQKHTTDETRSINKLLLYCLVITALLHCSCKKALPGEVKPEGSLLTLTVSDSSCTEVLLSLSVKNVSLPVEVSLYMGEEKKQGIIANNTDTLLFVTNLQPSVEYQFRAEIHTGQVQLQSERVKVRTLDTTSHNFTWRHWNLGTSPGNSCYLRDVAIIDENEIWAVGDIQMLDTNTATKYIKYNLVKWNGTDWKLEHVPFYNSKGDTFNVGIRAIYAFNKQEIVVGVDAIWLWDGKKFTDLRVPKEVFFSWVNKIWGISRNNFYIVGNNGSVARYYNGTWIKIESKTEIDIAGISGYYDKEKNQTIAFCVASLYGSGLGHKIIKIVDNTAEIFNSEGILPFPQQGIWVYNNKRAYVVGEGLYTGYIFRKSDIWKREVEIATPYFTSGVNGKGAADIYYCGAFGDIGHFNGVGWGNYIQMGILPLMNGSLYNIAAKGNTVCAVGDIMTPGTVGQARITMGKR